jgi:hypothetical protein
VLICTEPFTAMAHIEAAGMGMPDLPVVTVPHPLADRTADQVGEMAAGAIDTVVDGLLRRPPR